METKLVVPLTASLIKAMNAKDFKEAHLIVLSLPFVVMLSLTKENNATMATS